MADKDKKDDPKEIRFTLRLPADMYERLQECADEHFRSVNNQILSFIKKGLDRAEQGEEENTLPVPLAA